MGVLRGSRRSRVSADPSVSAAEPDADHPPPALNGAGFSTPVVADGSEIQQAIPFGVRIAAAWSWRAAAIILVAAGAVWLVIQLRLILIPVLVAVLLAGLLRPLLHVLERHRVPHGLAVVITFFSLLLGIGGLIYLVVSQLRSGFGDMGSRFRDAYAQLLVTVRDSPLGISEAQVNDFVTATVATAQADQGVLVAGALSAGVTIGHVLVGLLLTLFTTLFFLIDGKLIWRWCVRLAPRKARAAVDGAGRAGWISVGQYVRVQVFVALIDAVGILLFALFLQVPFAVPLAILTFLAAFIPFVGAILTGVLTVLVALLYNGPVNALIMLGGVLFVNQLESHVLQPLIMGNAVRVHPLAVVLAVSIGSLVGGIAGAVFAVPLVAAGNSVVKYIAGGDWKGQPPPDPGAGGNPSRRSTSSPHPEDVATVA